MRNSVGPQGETAAGGGERVVLQLKVGIGTRG